MERPLVNILQNGEIKVKHQIWAVFCLVYRMYKKKRFWPTYNKLVK